MFLLFLSLFVGLWLTHVWHRHPATGLIPPNVGSLRLLQALHAPYRGQCFAVSFPSLRSLRISKHMPQSHPSSVDISNGSIRGSSPAKWSLDLRSSGLSLGVNSSRHTGQLHLQSMVSMTVSAAIFF
jgi:hypothetical protein